MSGSVDKYYQISPDGGEPQQIGSARISKVGATLIGGGAFLLLLSIVALSVPASKFQRSLVVESTDFVGMPTSLRTGVSPWKQLAIDVIKVNNRCDRERDASMQALLTNFARTDRRSMTVLAEAAAEAESKVKTMPGVLPPLGFWDPWGLSTKAGDDTIAFYREAELKHGRTCMLAFLGIVVGEKFHPFNGGAEVDILGMPIESTPYTSFFSSVVLALIGFAELKHSAQIQGLMNGDKNYVAGDLGFDPLGIKPKKETEFLELQNKELSNGRLAMLAVAGAIAQEQVTLQKIYR